MLDSPPFAGNEITEEEYEAEADPYNTAQRLDDIPSHFIFFRCRHLEVRRFRVPKGKQALFSRMELAFDLIEKTALSHMAMRQTLRNGERPYQPVAVDNFALNCIELGTLFARIYAQLGHRLRSIPKRSGREVLTDPEEFRLAEEAVKQSLRSRLKWTPTCDRASMALRRDHKIEVDGKTLRRKFAHLKPKK